MRYHVEFFKPEEFFCPCCHRGQIASSLALFLDILRRAWAAPIIINSGWRCEKHNQEVGGVVPSAISPGSRHLIGCAVDIRPSDLELVAPFKNLVAALTSRRSGWEHKEYTRFVHVGVPREEASNLWSGSPIVYYPR